MSRVLITGIEGFVGGHLARHLADAGHTVIGLHLADPAAPLPAELHRGDICDFDRTKRIIEQTRPDAAVHLGGVTSVMASETHTLLTYEVNALGTIRLLEAVRQLKIQCRVLLISSADVYGRTLRPESDTETGEDARPLTEDRPPQPLSPYALSKLMAEEAGRLFHRAYGMDVVILRPFSHTGPGQAPLFVFPKVAAAIARIEQGAQEPVIEMGDLNVRRDYLDVRDVARAYAVALEKCVAGETYNVSSGKPITIRDGVELLCSLSRTPVTIRSSTSEFRPRDIPLLTGDPSKFTAATGWRPQIPFSKTLTDLLEFYRARR